MTNYQQQQTLSYFRRAAAEWRLKAEGLIPEKVNNIKQRNDVVMRIAEKRQRIENALDVGCGTGELVCALARTGVRAVGVDFASEMIELAQQKAVVEETPSAEFIQASVFDYKPFDVRFDLVSANGFIEYISGTQLQDFLRHAKGLLTKGGSLVLGSRNRLFNLFSLNEYTKVEFEKDTLQKLVAEAMILNNATTMTNVIQGLSQIDEPLPTIDRHPPTGIDVTTRHQYTPGQLVRLVQEEGFDAVEMFPIHYHAAVPRFAKEHAGSHVMMADLMQHYSSECHYLIPSASSFMLHARTM
jgi:2-polyprenyl-3-methyl-5-hydroxy-6-metoxy-1,4-benzoquinol methylase